MLKPVGKLIHADCRDPDKIRKRQRFPNTKEGRAQASAWIALTMSGGNSPEPKIEGLRTLEEAIGSFTKRTKFTTLVARTQQNYHYRLNEFVEWCQSKGIYYVYQFNAEAAEGYSQFVIDNYERKGIEARIGLIARIFRLERNRGTIQSDPFFEVKKTGYDPPLEIEHLTEEQIGQVFAAAPPRDAALAVLLFDSGMRAQELQNLKWKQITDTYIDIRNDASFTTKTGEAGTIPITTGIRMALDFFYPITGRQEYVILGNRPAHETYLNIRMARLCKRNPDLPKFTPQVLRSSLAMYLLDKGEDLHVVQRYLRHQSIKTTERHYGRVMMRHLNSAKEKVESGHQVSIIYEKLKGGSQ